VYKNGVWGFASNPNTDENFVKTVIENATGNAEKFASLAERKAFNFVNSEIKLSKDHRTDKIKFSKKEKIDFMMKLDEFVKANLKNVKSCRFFLRDQEIEKNLITSFGTKYFEVFTRAHIYCFLTVEKDEKKYELYESMGGYGNFEDNFTCPENLFPAIEELYEHLVKKSEGVYPEPGFKDVIIDSSLGGILAHEAVGHTTEADIVKGGSVARDLLNQKVSSELVTMVDFANTYDGKQLPVPIYVDDEGTVAEDAVLIENGILKGYMHNKESACEFNSRAQGNARAFLFSDEPLIRMRNTAILPGKSKLDDMVSSIKNGYYLMKTGNGQADSTSEFMFGIVQGYEIIDGKIGRALKDFTVSGVAFEMLKTVSMLSDEMEWENSGYCGKKQYMIVSSGSPAIKCKMNIGGR
ncbi:MAG: TldD/PmbA family protein, partial [Candidatus Moranbacteria bacterium]|nr:TldD/PmbA family protein [Candidatus Moranbacteria bacterium]